MLWSLLIAPALAEGPPAVLSLAPFGIDLYAQGKPARGALYTVTQVAGLAGWIGATLPARTAAQAEQETPELLKWQAVLISSATVTMGSYAVSVVDGSRLHELSKADPTARAWRAWDRQHLGDLALAPAPSAGPAPDGLSALPGTLDPRRPLVPTPPSALDGAAEDGSDD